MARYIVFGAGGENPGFITDDTHVIPRSGAIPIDDVVYAALLDGISKGKTLCLVGGVPVTVDPIYSHDDLAEVERTWRNAQLNGTTWLLSRNQEELAVGSPTSMSDESIAALLDYRQQLRDWPAHEHFPEIEWRPMLSITVQA